MFGILIAAVLVTAASCPSTDLSPTPTNQSPVASFTATPLSGNSPLQVQFNASASRDPDGTIVSYAWNFGDGDTSAGELVTHTYTATIPRSYTATLVIADNEGKTNSESKTIAVTVESSPSPAPCNCAGPDLNCSDFATHAAAQTCYDYCKQQGYGDVFRLDADSDGSACESLP